jgi:hypothetical protein
MLAANVGRSETRVVEGFSTDQQGRFTLRAVAPGDYALIIRPRLGPRETMAMDGRRVSDVQEFATVSLHVESDISDFVITTRPTLTISGRLIFAEGPPPAVPGDPDPLRSLRISATPPPGAGVFSSGSTAQVNPDLTFVLKGLSSAAIVRASGLPRNFTMKQVLVGTEDITDRPHEFVDRDSGELQVVLTSRVGGIEGTVLDEAGKPAVDSMVLLLLAPEEGRPTALFRTGNTDPRGHFRIDNLRAGAFAVIAVPRERMPRGNDPDALSALAREGQPLTLNDGEFRVLDLKVSGGGID